MDKFILIIVLIFLCLSGYFIWKPYQETASSKDYKKVQEYLFSKQPEDALEIVKLHKNQFRLNPKEQEDWLNLAIRTLELLPSQSNALTGLYESYPQAFDKHELAALIVAGDLIENNRIQDYELIKQSWVNKTHQPEDWFVLDSDALLIQGKRQEALDLLNSRSFEGPKDTKRLLRISFLNLKDNLNQSWSSLIQAEQKDPQNATVQTLKGQLLEDMNQTNEAEKAYKKAFDLDPTNPWLIDQLAEFYRNQNQYNLAIETWKKGLNLPKSDFILLKLLFWGKVYKPVDLETKEYPNTDSNLKPLVDYFKHLKSDQYWSSLVYQNVPEGSKYLKSRQETFWMQLIQMLNRGNEDEALLLLEYNPFKKNSWSPQIEQSLKHVLNYRNDESFDKDLQFPNQNKKSRLPFFEILNNAATTSKHSTASEKQFHDLHSLLKNEEVFTAIFLAGGWPEAAIVLHGEEVYPNDFPDWVAVEFTKALKSNRGDQQALNFALKQKESPSLNLLIGELLLGTGKVDAGMIWLLPLVEQDDEVGKKAALLTSIVFKKRGELDKAKEIILKQSQLSKSVEGKEILAKIELEEGNLTKAEEIYNSIAANSNEAKTYLAEKAIQEHNWTLAKQLTEELLKNFPNDEKYQDNYKKINKALRGNP